jgi:exonuclease III
MHTLDVLCV